MTQTMVDFLADPTNGCVVDDRYVTVAKQFGIIDRVRAGVVVDAAGHLDTPLFKQAGDAWKRGGIGVDAVLAFEFLPGFVDPHGAQHWPNEPLGTGTHRLTSGYVDRFHTTAQGFMRQVVPHGIDGAYAWNEPQVNLVLPGDNCPPGTRLKRDKAGNPLDAAGTIVDWSRAVRISDPGLNRSSLAPEAYASLVWQASEGMRAGGAKRIIAGAFNVLPQTGLDARNPYLLGYMARVYAHLASCGVKPNWTHLALTSEGYWTPATAQRMHGAIRACMDAHGDHSTLILAEWGVRNKGADSALLLQTGRAFQQVFPESAYFMAPGILPYLGDPALYPDYGLHSWRALGGVFVAGAPYPLYGAVRPVYASIPELTGAGWVLVHFDGSDFLTEHGWRFVPTDNPDGYGPMSGNLPLIDCTTAQVTPPGWHGPFNVLRPGKPT